MILWDRALRRKLLIILLMLDKRVGHVLKMPKEPTIGGVKSTKLDPSFLLNGLRCFGISTFWNKPTPWFWMSQWRHTMMDGVKFWIRCQQVIVLRIASQWQLIQNLVPFTTMGRQCDIWMLLLVLGKRLCRPKFRVEQVMWNLVIKCEEKCMLLKEFLEHSPY